MLIFTLNLKIKKMEKEKLIQNVTWLAECLGECIELGYSIEDIQEFTRKLNETSNCAFPLLTAVSYRDDGKPFILGLDITKVGNVHYEALFSEQVFNDDWHEDWKKEIQRYSIKVIFALNVGITFYENLPNGYTRTIYEHIKKL